jgi:hypothetical protein
VHGEREIERAWGARDRVCMGSEGGRPHLQECAEAAECARVRQQDTCGHHTLGSRLARDQLAVAMHAGAAAGGDARSCMADACTGGARGSLDVAPILVRLGLCTCTPLSLPAGTECCSNPLLNAHACARLRNLVWMLLGADAASQEQPRGCMCDGVCFFAVHAAALSGVGEEELAG